MSTDPTTRRRRWGTTVAALAVAVVALVIAGWRLGGGQWQVVATPSMGQAAPVGTLVLTREIAADEVAVGDVLTFHPPGRPGTTFTHRVVEITADGGFRTRGDANGADDPWVLHGADLVGEVVARWWAVGWLVRAVPLLVLGWALVWGGTRLWASATWRTPLRVFGSSLVVAVAAVLLKPFVALSVLMSTTDTDGTSLTVVSTGILPVRVAATGAADLRLAAGQVETLLARPTDGGYTVTTTPALTPGWWLVLGLVWSLPLLWCWWSSGRAASAAAPADSGSGRGSGPGPALGPDEESGPTAAETPGPAPAAAARRWATVLRRHRPRWRRAAAAVVAAGLAVAAPETAGAFSATVTNTANTAASAPWFTCVAADRAQGAWFVYSFSDALPVTLSGVADSSVNNRTGSYNGAFTSIAARPCPRDTTAARAVTVGGTSSYVQAPTQVVNPQVFSVEVWFRTTTPGGRLIGFGNSTITQSTVYDRHLYLTNTGQVVFGVFPGVTRTVTSPKTYLDNTWHHAVGTLSGAGMTLYLDGVAVASDASVTTAETATGYWRVGWDNLNTWPSAPTNYNYRGDLAFAAVYTSALTATQVRQNYVAGI